MIYLVDASVYVFRAHYSKLPDMVDRDGNPANAVYGFARFLGDLVERVRPRHIAVAFDQRMSGCFRTRLFPAYKANREPPPPGLAAQFGRCREICGRLGIASFASPEYEADDIIGTLARTMRQAGVRCALISRDKDLAQLMREGDSFWDYAARDPLGYADIERHFGVRPERFADYLALRGDAVDNIPGVPGIGPRTASILMQEYASLEELFDNLERLPRLRVRRAGTLVTLLTAHRETAFLSRRLTEIACDIPLGIGADDLRRRAPDESGLESLYDEMNFGPMLRKQAARIAQLPLE